MTRKKASPKRTHNTHIKQSQNRVSKGGSQNNIDIKINLGKRAPANKKKVADLNRLEKAYSEFVRLRDTAKQNNITIPASIGAFPKIDTSDPDSVIKATEDLERRIKSLEEFESDFIQGDYMRQYGASAEPFTPTGSRSSSFSSVGSAPNSVYRQGLQNVMERAQKTLNNTTPASTTVPENYTMDAAVPVFPNQLGDQSSTPGSISNMRRPAVEEPIGALTESVDQSSDTTNQATSPQTTQTPVDQAVNIAENTVGTQVERDFDDALDTAEDIPDALSQMSQIGNQSMIETQEGNTQERPTPPANIDYSQYWNTDTPGSRPSLGSSGTTGRRPGTFEDVADDTFDEVVDLSGDVEQVPPSLPETPRPAAPAPSPAQRALRTVLETRYQNNTAQIDALYNQYKDAVMLQPKRNRFNAAMYDLVGLNFNAGDVFNADGSEFGRNTP